MSQTKLQIRPRPGAEDKLSVGANMEVLLDGVPVKGVTFVKFEVKAKGIAKVMMELFATVEIDANVHLEESAPQETDLQTMDGQPIARYQIGNYTPVELVKKDKK